MFDSKAQTLYTGIMNAYQQICAIFFSGERTVLVTSFGFIRVQSRNKLLVPVACRMKAKLSLVPHLTLDDHHEPALAHFSRLNPAVLAASLAGHPLPFHRTSTL